MTELRFSWEISGSGWATCRIADGASERRDIVSYLTDALGDLLHGVTGLYGPDPVHRLSFDLEPAEIRWVLRSLGSGVEIMIYRFPDMSVSYEANDSEGTLVWTSRQCRSALGHAVTEAAESVLRLHGEEGYLAKWVRHPFPTTALQDLRRLHLRDDGCQREHHPSLP